MSVAADGGYDTALRMGITPDIWIGDADSVLSEVAAPEIVRLHPEKDYTDTYSAVQLALERGCTLFRFYGCTGGRTAHTMSNIQTLAMLAEQGLRGYLYGNGEIFTCVHNGAVSFSAASAGFLSVFSLSDESAGVTETGLKYRLDGYTMRNAFPIGVSNEFIGEKATVSVERGTLLLIYTDRAFIQEERHAANG